MNSSKDEGATSDGGSQRKIPFKRIKRAVDQIVSVAIPLHLQLLREKSEHIEHLKKNNSLSNLRAEQIHAVKFLKLLKADLYELEQLSSIVEEKDQDIFYSSIKDPIKEAVEAVSLFAESNPDADEPLLDVLPDLRPEFPKLVCALDQEYEEIPSDGQSYPIAIETSYTHKSSFPDWSVLRKELLEVHSLISKFATLVFSQKEQVNTIQGNVEDTHENVQEGVRYLKKAAILKAAAFPVAGAIIGGAFLGPVGLLAGFKLIGTAACVAGGGAIGYHTGAKLKDKTELSANMEMKALTYTAKEKSASNPELSINKDDS